MDRQVLSHPQGNRASPDKMMTWDDKSHHSKCSPFSSFPPRFICWARLQVVRDVHPLVQSGSAVPALSLPSISCTPSFLAGGMGWGAEKFSALCEHFPGTTKTSCYQSCFHQKSKSIAPYQLPWRKLILSHPEPVQYVEYKTQIPISPYLLLLASGASSF